MANLKIQRVTLSNWQQYKEIRLEALEKEPPAFGEDYKEALSFSDDFWKEKIQEKNTVILVAVENETFIGSIAVYFELSKKSRHVATIWGFYVREKYRGEGIGKMLLEMMEQEISTNKEVKKIKLFATATQKAAIELYLKYEYRKVGVWKKDVQIDGKFFDKYIFEKFIR